MAVASPNKQSDRLPDPPEGDELPYAPPEETFWHRYSWHGEFPISILAAIAIVVAIGAILIYILQLQFQGKKSDERAPVPTRGLKIADGERGGKMGGPGGGGGNPKEAVEPRPIEPQRQIPQAELKKEMISASAWVPDLKDNPDALERIVQSPGYDRLNKLNDELKRRAGQGFSGTGGKNSGTGMGPDKGPGPGGKEGSGDASTSGSRSVRWTILFRTNSGKDYLDQLAEFKAKIVIPEPPGWKTNILFTDVGGSPKGKPLTSSDELPLMQFVDEDRASASKVARALGLDFDPPYFAAYFTKEVEEELAAKERGYRGKREDQIYSTTFRVLLQNGKYVISVTDQVLNRK
jgi:hypothetical protein